MGRDYSYCIALQQIHIRQTFVFGYYFSLNGGYQWGIWIGRWAGVREILEKFIHIISGPGKDVHCCEGLTQCMQQNVSCCQLHVFESEIVDLPDIVWRNLSDVCWKSGRWESEKAPNIRSMRQFCGVTKTKSTARVLSTPTKTKSSNHDQWCKQMNIFVHIMLFHFISII